MLECTVNVFLILLLTLNLTTYLIFVCAVINNVNNSAICVHTAILSYSCIKACIGFALRVAEPLNGFLRALLEIPLTTQQGVDLSFLFFFFLMGANNLM